MKRLKNILKGVLPFIVGALLIYGLLVISQKEYENAVESCVKGGNSQQFCEINLR